MFLTPERGICVDTGMLESCLCGIFFFTVDLGYGIPLIGDISLCPASSLRGMD